MKTNILLLLLLPLLIGTSCKKDKDDGLTKATQTGANTFSCKINGENFIAKQDLFGPKAIFVANVLGVDGYFLIDGRLTDSNPYKEIEIKIFEEIKMGTYSLGGNSQNYGSITYRYPDDLFKSNIDNVGQITFAKVDNVNKIYFATFSFSCINSKGEVTNITKGRFDTKVI